MAKIKKIGIPGWSLGDNAWGVTKPYLEYLSQFGQVEILTPRQGIVEGLDLVILPGGQDTNPANYDAVPSFYTGSNDTFKEYFFRNNLQQYIEVGTPIFGICLGMQQLNCFFGGSLVQHYDFPYSDKNRSKLVEKLDFNPAILKDLNLRKLPANYKVNSMHHQGVIEANLAPELISLASSSIEPQNVEIFKHKELPIYGVQYHPEELNDSIANIIITKLLNL